MGDKGKVVLGIIFVVALFIGAILLAGYVDDNESVQNIIASFGPLGILVVSFIGGLNLVVPVPATAFIPVFSAAGFNLWLIITIIVLGTTVADLLSFYIGTTLKKRADKTDFKILKFIRKYCTNKPRTTQFIIFLWATLIPFPNEVLLLPLGTLGVKLKTLLVPFTLGNAIHVTLLAFGLNAFI